MMSSVLCRRDLLIPECMLNLADRTFSSLPFAAVQLNLPKMTARNPVVLITNDDGPPNDIDSPFIESFVQTLRERLGWKDVRVVIPSSQKSWIVSMKLHQLHYYPDTRNRAKRT